MRTGLFAIMTAGNMFAAVLLTAGPATARATELAQANFEGRMGPSRSPDVVVEEPRPPRAIIETEGRGEHRSCQPVTITEWHDGVKVTRTQQQCDR